MLNAIAKPFGMLLMWLYELVANYGLAVILFGLIVKIILMPFQLKSKRSTMRTARLQPAIQDIQKRYAGNQAKINAETQKLYKDAGVKPMSGCIWSLIPFPILIALYQAIRFPLTMMMRVPDELLKEGGSILAKLTELGFESAYKNAGYIQIEQAQFISNNFDKFAGLSDKLTKIDYSFLGLDLGAQPKWNFFFTMSSSDPDFWKMAGLFLIPIIAAVLTWLTTKVTSSTSPQNDQTAQTMKSMNIMMPAMTLVFAFMMPAALGIYWIASSAFGIIQDLIVGKAFKKKMAEEDREFNEKMRKREEELEAKRQETERLRAMNATVQNKNTSKRKQQVKEREERDAKAAEWEKTHNPQTEKDVLPSQVGNRKYARGRAYVADRFEAAPEAEETVETAEAVVEETVAEIPEEIDAVEAVETVEEDIVEAEEEYEDEAEEEADDEE